jgi:hypothetical protein
MKPQVVVHPFDEGYISAFAARMLDGQMLPFVDAVSHRGPVLYWVVAMLGLVWDPLTWTPVRVAALLAMLVTAVAAFACGARAGKPLAGAIGALALPVACLVDMRPLDGIALNGEHVLNAFMLPALYCLVAGLDRRRANPSVPLVLSAGVLSALGALTKQVGAISIFPFGLWVAVAALSRPGLTATKRRMLVIAFCAGVALPVLITLARYALAGELRTVYYWTVTYNAEIYMAPFTVGFRRQILHEWITAHIVPLCLAVPIVGWAATRPLVLAMRSRDLGRAYDESGFIATVGLGTVAVIASSNAALRDFPHYYVQLVPWGGLLLGLAVDHGIGRISHRNGLRAAIVHALVLLPIVVLASIGWNSRRERCEKDRFAGRAFPGKELDRVCAYVNAHTKPSDRIFVWGFSPSIYVTCHRMPASRFVYTTMVAGFVPWIESTKQEEDARAVPGSRERLIADLEEARPPLIIDAAESMAERNMKRYEVLGAYLDKHYCSKGKVDAYEVFARLDERGQCPD